MHTVVCLDEQHVAIRQIGLPKAKVSGFNTDAHSACLAFVLALIIYRHAGLDI